MGPENPNLHTNPEQPTTSEESLESPEVARPHESLEERRNEVIQDIRSRHGILYIACSPHDSYKVSGLPAHESEWVREGLGLPKGTDRLTMINALEEPLPSTVQEQGVIIGGSIHSVYENTPWIKRLEEFVRAMYAQGKPMLGICFGHQIIAQAFGGKVEKGEKGGETGAVTIDLDEEGALDPVFEGLNKQFASAMAHHDVVSELPQLERVAVLAKTSKYNNQAMAIGDKVRTVQFHPEMTRDIIGRITRYSKEELLREGDIPSEADFEELMKTIQSSEIDETGRRILQNFDTNFVLRLGEKK